MKYHYALAAAVLAGCATSPHNVQQTYVSPLPYMRYDCDQLGAELTRVNSEVDKAMQAQQSVATGDAVATTVGLLVFWPALFALAATPDHSAELGRLKGERNALEEAAIEKDCPGVSGLASAREEREELEAKERRARISRVRAGGR